MNVECMGAVNEGRRVYIRIDVDVRLNGGMLRQEKASYRETL